MMKDHIDQLLNNPFCRGFDRFTIDRLAVVTTADAGMLQYRRIIDSEKTKDDWKLFGEPCLIDTEFVYLLDDQSIPTSSQTKAGRILSVVYAITGYMGFYHAHVGDAITLNAARSTVETLSFIPGHYGRCWQISTRHLPDRAFTLLQAFLYDQNPDNALLDVFSMHDDQSMGIQFFQPESQQRPGNLQSSLTQYRDKLLCLLGRNAPDSLIQLLLLAYFAGVSILIMSDQAPVLEGLPVFDIG